MLAQKQMVPQRKGLILSFWELESLRAWHYQEGSKPIMPQKGIGQKNKFNGLKIHESCANLIHVLRKVWYCQI